MIPEVIIMREEEKKRNSKISRIRRFLSKRWALPAIYIACAAILLTAVLWFQGSNDEVAEPGEVGYEEAGNAGSDQNREAVEVNSDVENFSMPIVNSEDVVVKTPFFDVNDEKADQENALVYYNNQYHLNRGIDIAMNNGETFDVVASLSGKVTKVLEDSLLGNVVEIEHQDGITTHYQSLTDIAVKEGDSVTQGQSIAKAGKSLFNGEAGIHVHFEIRKDAVAVNPQDYFLKPVSALVEAELVNKATQETEESTPKESTEDEPSSEEETDKVKEGN